MTVQESPDTDVNPLLSEDAFQNEQSRRLFEAIDELRSCGANHEIDLPELIIVGDQSAGKSSLLQSLTDIPFPVSDRLCTRFPTRIVSRRTPFQPESIKVSIEPSSLSTFEDFSQKANIFSSFDQTLRLDRLDRYAQFTRVIPNLTAEGYKDILNEAIDLMEIPRPTSSEIKYEVNGLTKTKRNFSNDVLKVEISGPNRSYFSILDLPGIFQSLTKDLTEVEKFGVKNLSTTYMSSKHSVIICVASGTNDLANQGAFDLASEKDPRGDRTVGVITKCDIAQHPNQLMDLARNTEKYFRHGWFVVRNRTPSEVAEAIEPLDRQTRETDFFNSAPWNTLPAQRRGTQALKVYLAELLANRILESFPTMLTTIADRIKSTTSRLEGLGSPRGTLEEKRGFLTKIAQEFNSLAAQALRGRYDSLPANNVKLRRLVREVNDTFSHDMKTSGHAVPFVEQPQGDGKDQNGVPVPNFGAGFGDSATNDQGLKVATPFSSGKANMSGSPASSVRVLLPFTKDMLYEKYIEKDHRESSIFQSICTTAWSRSYSFEEIRLSDYFQDHQTPTKPKRAFASSVPSPEVSDGLSQSGGAENLFTASFNTPSKGIFGGTASSTSAGLSSHANVFRHATQSREFSEMYTWIKLEVKANRGTELQGTFNPDILPALFHKQIRKWSAYSEAHFKQVTKITVDTLVALLARVCPDPLVRARLEKVIRGVSDTAEQRGLKQLSNRLTTLASTHLQTNNSAFVEKVRIARLQRFQAALERYRLRHAAKPVPKAFGSFAPASVEPDPKFTIDMRDTALLFDELHVSNSQNLEDEIHDILKAYYEIARDDFVEYVNHLIVEPYLNSPDGPVLFFSPLHVSEMPPEQLESLVVEPVSQLRERTDLQSTLVRLQHAEAIAQKYS